MNITSWPNEPNIVDGAYNPPSKGYDNNKGFSHEREKPLLLIVVLTPVFRV